MSLLTTKKKKVVLAILNPTLFLIYLSHFPQFQVYLALQKAFIKHLFYATNLIIGKGIFPHQEPVSPSGGRITVLRMDV